jgi:hypothetical protein
MSARSPSRGWDRHPNLRARPHAPAAARGRLQKARSPAHAWDRYPNLRLGLGGARGNGRLQRAVARAFVGNHLVTSTHVFNWCFPRDRGVSWRRRHRWSVVRVLNQVADRVGRANTPGRPWIWRLR